MQPEEHIWPVKAKALAAEIAKTIALVAKETAPCGSNPSFYNDVSRELLKIDHFAIEKLAMVLETAIVLERL
jgi:hypothetical protein